MDDTAFIARFLACEFTQEEWRHKDHIQAAYLHLRAHPFDEALDLLRARINALNAVHRVPDLPHRGYHETMTRAWLQLVDTTLREFGPAESADAFYEQHPQLAQKRNLLLFYSRDLLMSPRAKAEWVEPDLAPLPRSARNAVR